MLAFGDEPKPGVQDALKLLRQRGLRLVMISGDNKGAAQAMAARLGLQSEEVFAEVSPGDKAALVKSLQAHSTEVPHVVAFVGDGINDALALHTADVGYVLELGRIMASGTSAELMAKDDIKEFYLGIGRSHEKTGNPAHRQRWKQIGRAHV